jgi:hypothetical protein
VHTSMDDNKPPVRTLSSNRERKQSPPNVNRSIHDPLHLALHTGAKSSPDRENFAIPTAPSKRAERIFPISSVVPLPTPTPSSRDTNTLGFVDNKLFGSSSPTPYSEGGNPFDGERLYLNFNAELEREQINRESQAARHAAAHDTPGAERLRVLQHPMTMRFQHKETESGHHVVTV